MKMFSQKKYVIRTLFLVLLLPLASMFSMFIMVNATFPSDSDLRPHASDVYYDDFTTTTYMNGVETSAIGWGLGAITKEREFFWNLVDFFPTIAPVIDVDVQGRKVYTALYNETAFSTQLLVLSLTDPTNIVAVGESIANTKALALAVDGDQLYMGQYNTFVQNSFVTYNVTNPTNPSWNVAWGLGGGIITDLDPEGHLVYFTAYDDPSAQSLRIFNATNIMLPNNYIPCNWANNNSLGLEVDGHLAYVASSEDGLYVLNITQYEYAFELGHVDTPGNATDVIIEGRFAYVADGPEGIHIVDINDPTNPTIVSSFDTHGHARRMVKQGNTLFIADGIGGIIVLDVSNPYRPIFVSEIFDAVTWDVDLFGGDLVVATDAGVFVYQTGQIGNIFHNAFENPFDQFEVWDVRVRDGIAFVAGGHDGFYTVDVRDPRNPVLLDRWNQTGVGFKKLDINEQFAFCCEANGIFTFDIQQPANIKLAGYNFGMDLTDCDVEGELLYCSHDGGFAILNVSSITSAFWVKVVYNGMVNCTAIWAQTPFIYLVEGKPGSGQELRCYNVRDLQNPYMTFGTARIPLHYDIHVDGDVCLLGAGGWMSVYNCSNPYSFSYPDWATNTSVGVWSYGPYVISAEHAQGVTLYDTTDVFTVTPMSNYQDAIRAWQVTTSGDYSYVANESSLVILRHFESAADTYIPGSSIAQSLEVDTVPNGTIYDVTLTVNAMTPIPTNIEYFVSVNGGTDWIPVLPGVKQSFSSTPGNELMWRALFSGPKDVSPHLYEINLHYEFEYETPPGGLSRLMLYILIGVGGGLLLIILIIVIVVVVRKKKAIPTR